MYKSLYSCNLNLHLNLRLSLPLLHAIVYTRECYSLVRQSTEYSDMENDTIKVTIASETDPLVHVTPVVTDQQTSYIARHTAIQVKLFIKSSDWLLLETYIYSNDNILPNPVSISRPCVP